jgi:hypothetical protein
VASKRAFRILLVAGLAALIAALTCALLSPRGALTGWLGAAVLVQALPLTGLMLLAMMRLIPGVWEDELRRTCEALARLWPLAALAFVPILAGLPVVYDWTREPPLSAFQAEWLGPWQYAVRTSAWLAALAWIARSQIGRQASIAASVVALVVLVMGNSLIVVDWLLSLDPKFHSSGFGLQLLSLEVAAGYAVLLIAGLLAAPAPKRTGVLGGLLLTLLLLWAYFQFMPFLIIWSGNLPDGVAWYDLRSGGAWTATTVVFAALGLLPVLALLLPEVRTRRWPLLTASGCALTGKVIEFAWFSVPGRGAVAVIAFGLAVGGFAFLTAAWLGIAVRRPG